MSKALHSDGNSKQARQEVFLKAVVLERGYILPASERSKIARQTHYVWLATDPTYRERFEAAKREAHAELNAEVERATRKVLRKGDKHVLRHCRRQFGNELVDAILAGDESPFLPR